MTYDSLRQVKPESSGLEIKQKKHYWRNIVTRCKFLIASLYVNDTINHIRLFENIADRSWYKSEGKLALFMSYDFYAESKAR